MDESDKNFCLKSNKKFGFKHKLLTGFLALFMGFNMVGCGRTPTESTPDNPTEPNPIVTPNEPTEPSEPVAPKDPEPEEPTDPIEPIEPAEPEPEVTFDKNNPEHIAKLEENLAQTFAILKSKACSTRETIKEVKGLSLIKNEASNKVDTIGVAMITDFNGDLCLNYSTITLPVEEDLTYDKIFNDGIVYGDNGIALNSITANRIYSNNINKETEQQYQDTANSIYNQLFEDVDSADWLGWKRTTGPASDVHIAIMLNDNKIEERDILMYHPYGMSMVDVVAQKFVGQEPSDETYSIYKSQTIEINGEFLNLSRLREQVVEKEQNI